jgi:protein-arginine deiminase
MHGGTARSYPFGRIVYGGDTVGRGVGSRRMHPATRALLAAQQLQDPIEIHSDWLTVGHVDEFISFLPGAGGSHGWKVMIAAPARALQIVLAQPDATPLFHGANMAQPHLFRGGLQVGDDFPLRTVGHIRANAAFRRLQTTVNTLIDNVKTTKLMPELNLVAADFIEIPILFTKSGFRHIAYNPGSVNMLVITEGGGNRLIVPKPYGPFVGGHCLFEQAITANIGAGALSIDYVDDMQSYHTGQGEIHCGSNSQRTPQTDRWWDLPWIV